MIRSRLQILSFCLLGGITIIALLNIVSSKINHRPNGFIRLVPPHVDSPVMHLDIHGHSFYIGGLANNIIYLFNYNSPYEFDAIPLSLKTIEVRHSAWSNSIKISRSSKINVDSPYIFLNDGFSSRILTETLNQLNSPKIDSMPSFYSALAIGDQSFVLKVTAAKIGTELIKINAKSHFIKENRKLLQKQGDDFFSTDGILLKTPDNKKIIYVYYYRNQFIVADSNLNLLYRSRTIDTVSHPNIRVSHVQSEQALTMSAPPRVVNKRACVSEKYLFVNSSLYANNERPEDVDQMSIIDVYRVTDGKYQFSFYLPDFGRHKISDFIVSGNILVALYDHFINSYKLDFNMLRNDSK